jgi:hypothetical protein
MPFAFSRWGDGEWYNVNKKHGQNCDGNIYYSDLGDKLLQIVSTPRDYHMGVQTLMPYSVEQSKRYPQHWGDSDVFHKASMKGELSKFIDVLHKMHVVYIGNQSLHDLPFINEFIEIPYNNVWLNYDDIFKQIVQTFDDRKFKVYCFSAGMACNVFIHDLWNCNKHNAFIDVGSVFDPYVGRNSRSYHNKLNIKVF